MNMDTLTLCQLHVEITARIKTNPAVKRGSVAKYLASTSKTAVLRGVGDLHSTGCPHLVLPGFDIVKQFSTLGCVSGISTSARTPRPTTEGPAQSARGVSTGARKQATLEDKRRVKCAAGGAVMAESDELNALALGSSVQAHHLTVSCPQDFQTHSNRKVLMRMSTRAYAFEFSTKERSHDWITEKAGI